MRKKISFLIFFLSVSPIFATDILEEKTMKSIEAAIKLSAKKHAAYSYNVANANTPGFKPILFEEDIKEIQEMFPENQNSYTEKVMIDHMAAKIVENNSKRSGYVAIYKKRLENLRMIATLGKK